MNPVLVVEDEPVVRQVMVRLLQTAGHLVVEAQGVAAARRASAGRALKVAVIDKNLPDGSGIDLAAELVRADPELPAIILSGYASDAAARAALDAGVFDFLRKPLEDVRELVAAVARAEEARRAGRTRRPLGAAGGPVVVCDDGPRGDALAAELARAGKPVARAASVADALRALVGGGAAALIVAGEKRDAMRQLLDAARAARPPVPAVVVAGRGALDDVILALRAGAAAYLVNAAPEEVIERLAG
jgi:DNA-binding NtrC family response regulator